jgi:hypothetical protein
VLTLVVIGMRRTAALGVFDHSDQELHGYRRIEQQGGVAAATNSIAGAT